MRKQIDKNWYNSKKVRPKTITLTLERNANGSYIVQRGVIVNKINQYVARPQKIDARDLISDIRSKGVVVL